MEWFEINNVDQIDSPALLIYKSRVEENIDRAIHAIKDREHLRPHIKTNKIAEVCEMMMKKGINKFKCATIAEAEMLAMINAEDVLLAYQPVGPKAVRLFNLALQYPAIRFSCIVDDIGVAKNLSAIFSAGGKRIGIFIDLNSGMNRTGIATADAYSFYDELRMLPALEVRGIHSYDGHIRTRDSSERQQRSDEAFEGVKKVLEYIKDRSGAQVTVVSGGSPTFPTHIKRNVECSPGTFVFWDWGYKQQFPDQPFDFAALVMTRIISIVNNTQVTTDLGYKSVSSENPLPRVHFLNAPYSKPISQSEEHLCLQVPDSSIYNLGDVLFGVPVHICPTISLYDKAWVVENHEINGSWKVAARSRMINY